MALINVPNSGQTLGGTRASVNSNFSTTNNAFEIDHVEMTAPGNIGTQGFHNKVTLVVQPGTPGPGMGTTYNGIYNLLSAITNKNETFFHFQKQTGTLDIPVTASVRSTTATPATINNFATGGWCYLPSGFVMKWGTITAGSTPGTVVFPSGGNIPAFTAIQSLQLTVGNTANVALSTINYYGVTTSQFQWYSTIVDTNWRFNYLAIGY